MNQQLLDLYNNMVIMKDRAAVAEQVFAQACSQAGIDPRKVVVSFGNPPPPAPETPKTE